MRIIKKIICVFLRVPAVVLGAVFADLSYYLLKFHVWITAKEFGGGDSLKSTQDRLQSIKPGPPIQNHTPGESVPQSQYIEGLPSVAVMLQWLEQRSPDWLNRFRQTFEDSVPGSWARGESSDRHLYAVKIPTQAENIQRIRNVFFAMTPTELAHAQEIMKPQTASIMQLEN